MTIHIQRPSAYGCGHSLARKSLFFDAGPNRRLCAARSFPHFGDEWAVLSILVFCLIFQSELLAQPGDQADHDRGIALARQAMDAGDYAKAVELLNLVVQGWPQDTTAKEMLAQAKAANGQKDNYSAAMDAARQSLNAGDYDTAVARANDALAARPGDKAAQNLVTRANLRKNMASASSVPPPEPPPTKPERKVKSSATARTAKTSTTTATTPPPTVAETATPAPTPGPAVETPAPALAPADASSAPSKPLPVAKATRNEVSVSGDYFLGQGTVTLPVGFSLEGPLATEGAEFKKSVASPDRSSTYYGGTISYSFNQSIYLDASYQRGTPLAISISIPATARP